jgi:sporulation protein YlmC with PRC-barrel domain
MKRMLMLVLLAAFVATLQFTNVSALKAQVAGTQSLGATTEELKIVTQGWSIKKSILGKDVYNDRNEKVGTVDDLIISKDMVNYAIIGAGGFVGLAKHNVAIPFDHLSMRDGKIILPGATKELVKAMPEFQYPKG